MRREPEFGEDFELHWTYVGSKQVGETRNYVVSRKGYRRIPIFLDDELMNRIHMRLIVSRLDSKGEPEICVSTQFMTLPERLREAAVWHEVGHVHLGHLWHHDEIQTQEDLRRARLAAVEAGRVLEAEVAADRFAVQRIGKDRVVELLRFMRDTRPSAAPDGWEESAQLELSMRIALVELQT